MSARRLASILPDFPKTSSISLNYSLSFEVVPPGVATARAAES